MQLNKLLTVFVAISLSSCSVVREFDNSPNPLEVNTNKSNTSGSNDGTEEVNSSSNQQRISRSLPKPPQQEALTSALSFEDAMDIEGQPIALNVAGLPLPEFIHEVLGRRMGLSYHLDPKLENKSDLVTLNIEKPLSPRELYKTVQTVLTAYGVTLKNVDGLINVEFSPAGASSEPPILISGEALPTVPTTHRPVFFLMDLKVVEAQRAVGWLAQAFEGQNAKFSSDPERNAVWLRGSLDVVKQAAEVVRLVDQPLMRGRHSMRIEPKYLGADTLSKRLTEMLGAQGYHAREGKPGAISLFTIEETNSIIVFANDEQVLSYVAEWVEDLDKPLKKTKGNNVFYYQVKNTAAEDIAESMNQLLSNGFASSDEDGEADGGKKSSTTQRGRLVVDESRNALLFYGTNSDWVTMLPAIERLDQKPLQVLIEVIVAEVRLSDDFTFGVDWAINNVNSNLFGTTTPDSISITEAGLSFYPISSSGYTRAVLSMLATDSKVNILQTPRILVRSGQIATINVGDEIPILTASQTSTEGGAVTQEIQYRKTGNNLSVEPIVFAGGQVNITLTQEISQSSATGSTTTPTISSRSVSTSLSIQDGGSVLVGGLIQNTKTSGGSKVPFFGDLPIVGKLFTDTKDTSDRTELMVLIAPYVVKDNDDANAVTEAFKKQLEIMYE
ncbi:secretin N-terminal domain-containing protein [Aestuariibacter sp. A3R04]|uniref:secretin N-terminal domain-containing protein n=1 Tax=Aestuariibacter sp. A3R04 TaxID=2841571 RepID=UPI001C095BC4|nr:secretin N-terminal domain-containing protein [Aestuariibacter sp. A3R04]MBU3023405.1 hypothetical protein [Aestuariibacter sp. A3R04]